MIVLDTHALIWWTQEPNLLSRDAQNAIKSTDSILLPTIVFWETALLVRKKRLQLRRSQSVYEWATATLSIPRVHAITLSVDQTIKADSLQMHPDPADRFIVATTLEYQCPLVTKDTLLHSLSWVKTIW